MDVTTLVSVEEYLRTSYPVADREYIDGRIVERNVGEVDHCDLQTAVAHYLRTQYVRRVWVGVAVRVQVRKNAFPCTGRHSGVRIQTRGTNHPNATTHCR